jgi:hypothetical protein
MSDTPSKNYRDLFQQFLADEALNGYWTVHRPAIYHFGG